MPSTLLKEKYLALMIYPRAELIARDRLLKSKEDETEWTKELREKWRTAEALAEERRLELAQRAAELERKDAELEMLQKEVSELRRRKGGGGAVEEQRESFEQGVSSRGRG